MRKIPRASKTSRKDLGWSGGWNKVSPVAVIYNMDESEHCCICLAKLQGGQRHGGHCDPSAILEAAKNLGLGIRALQPNLTANEAAALLFKSAYKPDKQTNIIDPTAFVELVRNQSTEGAP